MIYLVYNSPFNINGPTTYTVHLKKLLGDQAKIIKLGNRTESKPRPMGEYGESYQIMSREDAAKLDGPLLLTASTPKFECYIKGMYITFHDPKEAWLHEYIKADEKRVICIREIGLKHYPKSTFIPHPYIRSYKNELAKKTLHAVSTARIAANKHTDLIYTANAALPKKFHVKLVSLPNRMYVFYVLNKRFPHAPVPTKGFPRTFNSGAAECLKAKWMVDLSTIPQDGGGTQYTFLESLDAGSVPIMHKDWTILPGPAKKFGPSVANADELIALLRTEPDIEQVKRNWKYLDRVHNQNTIRKQYQSILGS